MISLFKLLDVIKLVNIPFYNFLNLEPHEEDKKTNNENKKTTNEDKDQIKESGL